MVRSPTIPNGTARVSAFVARHPKLVVGLVAMVLFLAVQDGALAAEAPTADPNSDGAVFLGPDPEED